MTKFEVGRRYFVRDILQLEVVERESQLIYFRDKHGHIIKSSPYVKDNSERALPFFEDVEINSENSISAQDSFILILERACQCVSNYSGSLDAYLFDDIIQIVRHHLDGKTPPEWYAREYPGFVEKTGGNA